MEVVGRARICDQLHPIVFSLPRAQEAANLLVGGEDSRCRAQLGAHVGNHVPIHRAQSVEPRPIVFDDPAHSALNAVAAQHLEDHVFGAHPIWQPAGELHPPDLGHGREKCLARHGQRHFQSAGSDGQHAQCAARRSVAVGAEERSARLAEVLLVARVAHAISRPGIPHAETLARAAQEQVVIGILVIRLDDVVVDVLDADLGLHPIQAHGFELQHHQCASRILGQRLIDANPDFFARLHVAVHQMRPDQFLRNIRAHGRTPITALLAVINLVQRELLTSSIGAGTPTICFALMDMDVSAGVTLENLDGKVLLLGVPGSHPKQQPTVIELLLDTLRVLVAEKFREPRSDQPSGSAAQCSRGGHCGKRPAGSGNRPHEHTRPNVHERTDDSPLTVTDRLGRNIGRSWHRRVVCKLAGLAILVPKLGHDVRFACEQA